MVTMTTRMTIMVVQHADHALVFLPPMDAAHVHRPAAVDI